MALSRIVPIHTGHYTMPRVSEASGTGRARLGSYTMPADRPDAGQRIVVTAFVIEHPRGVFLFDTGFSPEPKKMVDLYQPVYMRPLDDALRAAGHALADVDIIANCHFHADHSGGNRHFPNRPILVQRNEVAHARTTADYTYLPHVADFPNAQLEEVDGEAEPWPGIRIVPTPGHSPGHQSLVVETKEGRVVLAGQALNFASDYARHRYSHELELAGEPHGDYPEWIARFQAFDPVRVHFAHDRVVWQRETAAAIV